MAHEPCFIPNYLSGPTGYSLGDLTIDGRQFQIHLISDEHFSWEGACKNCREDEDCMTVAKFINHLISCDPRSCQSTSTHIFPELHFHTRSESLVQYAPQTTEDPMDAVIKFLYRDIRSQGRSCVFTHYTDFRSSWFLSVFDGKLYALANSAISGASPGTRRYIYVTENPDEAVLLAEAIARDLGWWNKTQQPIGNWWRTVLRKLAHILFFSNDAIADLQFTFPKLNRFFRENRATQTTDYGVAWERVKQEEFTTYRGNQTVHKIRKSLLQVSNPIIRKQIWRYLENSLKQIETRQAGGYLDEDGFNGYAKGAQLLLDRNGGVDSSQDLFILTEIITTELGGLALEIYCLSRLFREFDIDRGKHSKRGIFYLGEYHTNHLKTFFTEYLHVKWTGTAATDFSGKRCLDMTSFFKKAQQKLDATQYLKDLLEEQQTIPQQPLVRISGKIRGERT